MVIGSNPVLPTILKETSDRARERRCLQNSRRWERYPQKSPFLLVKPCRIMVITSGFEPDYRSSNLRRASLVKTSIAQW